METLVTHIMFLPLLLGMTAYPVQIHRPDIAASLIIWRRKLKWREDNRWRGE